jgi:hypothetical protein
MEGAFYYSIRNRNLRFYVRTELPNAPVALRDDAGRAWFFPGCESAGDVAAAVTSGEFLPPPNSSCPRRSSPARTPQILFAPTSKIRQSPLHGQGDTAVLGGARPHPRLERHRYHYTA